VIEPIVKMHANSLLLNSLKFLVPILFGVTVSNSLVGQDNYKQWVLEQRTPGWALTIFNKLSLSDQYKISDFVNPFYLEEDLNGDSNRDIALLIEEIDSRQKGIIIIHGQDDLVQVIGAGTKFGNGSGDYSWMDVWKVFRGSKANELVISENGDIEGSQVIEIKNPCLEVVKTEAASGLIYWDGSKYKWMQMSD
jgi:hypothetical protein